MTLQTKTIVIVAAMAGLMSGCATPKPKACKVCKMDGKSAKASCSTKGGCSTKGNCGTKANCNSKNVCRAKGNCGTKKGS